jgi:hypothetical protein
VYLSCELKNPLSGRSFTCVHMREDTNISIITQRQFITPRKVTLFIVKVNSTIKLMTCQ